MVNKRVKIRVKMSINLILKTKEKNSQSISEKGLRSEMIFTS